MKPLEFYLRIAIVGLCFGALLVLAFGCVSPTSPSAVPTVQAPIPSSPVVGHTPQAVSGGRTVVWGGHGKKYEGLGCPPFCPKNFRGPRQAFPE